SSISAQAVPRARWLRSPGLPTTTISSRSRRSRSYPSKGDFMDQRVHSRVANIERLHAFMDRNGLAALVARSGQNFSYLSEMAYPGTLQRMLDLTDSPRGTIV